MYDLIFITHLPSFYKVNLYNEIAKSRKVMVIFIGSGSSQRTSDFTGSECQFDFHVLHEGAFEERSRVQTCLKLFRLLKKYPAKRVVVGGWDLCEFWLSVFALSRAQNALALESTDHESGTIGLKGIIKRIFVRRLSKAFVTGTAHGRLLQLLSFTGAVTTTHGVGLLRPLSHTLTTKEYEGRFLYLGRLSPEKNLHRVIEVFNRLPQLQLQMVGDGPLAAELKQIAGKNILFSSHVSNDRIADVFAVNDFLILASVSETWGLVVEEAIAHRRPVIVSSACGVVELVTADNGFIFNPNDSESLFQVLSQINSENYRQLSNQLDSSLIERKNKTQVQAYIEDTRT